MTQLRHSIRPLLPTLAFFLAALGACRGTAGVEQDADAAAGRTDANVEEDIGDYKYPRPRTGVVAAVGSDTTFEMATWNIENFPANDNTPALVADLIASMDIDMIAVQEIADIAAFEELVERLRGYEGFLSTHTYGSGNYQKVGYIYRSNFIDIGGIDLLFSADRQAFPRPALKVEVQVSSPLRTLDFRSLTLHLKASGDEDSHNRRLAAVHLLDEYLKSVLPEEPDVIVLGDYNATFERDPDVLAVMNDSYVLRTVANDNAGEISFIPANLLFDHITLTRPFNDQLAGSESIIPRLDRELSGYVNNVSDHLPVILVVPGF